MTIARLLIVLLAIPLVILVVLGIFVALQLGEIDTRTRFGSESMAGFIGIRNESRNLGHE